MFLEFDCVGTFLILSASSVILCLVIQFVLAKFLEPTVIFHKKCDALFSNLWYSQYIACMIIFKLSCLTGKPLKYPVSFGCFI